MTGRTDAVQVGRVQLQDAAVQRWRNGAGLTRELLAWRPGLPEAGSGLDWLVRVSVAEITADGPFSAFPGVWRGFAVLEGAGVALTLNGRTHRLTPHHDPIAFDGVQAPGCALIDGATRDLNLMVQQEAGRLQMQRACPGQAWGGDMPWRGLYVHAAARVETSQGHTELAGGTLIWSQRAADAPWQLLEGAQAWWLGIQPPARAGGLAP